MPTRLASIQELHCVVVAPGPSFQKFLNSQFYNDILHDLDLPIFGCGSVTKSMKCNYYAINDKSNFGYLPNDGTLVIAHPRVWMETFIRWNPNLLFGGTSGGLALAAAASKYLNIGVVGFDDKLSNSFVTSMEREVFTYWSLQGRAFYSLMDNSIFNDSLIKVGDYY